MPDNQYPVFESGQTLTAADLNMLRSFLHERDRLVGRMIGFGINCGLGGVVSGASLTIQPGLAVDQYGEPLVLPGPISIALAPTAMTPSYDFIDTGPGGFSVVLEATDTVEPAPDCGEVDCAGHAELHTKGVTLRTVAGRVTGTRMDFSNETLLTVEPIRLALDSTPINSYNTLRNAIATRLTNGTTPLVSTALIAKLQATSIGSGDSPAIRGYKCGWLNMVLFATLDLLRVEALMKLACDRSTTRPGVVVGWVHLVGGFWVFDCRYRHAWEPPRGFSEAFFGGTCTDPAGSYRDELEALLAGYAPPEPVPSGPVGPPVFCPHGSILINGHCVNIYYPPPEIPDRWYGPWEIDPIGPIWYPPPEVFWQQPWVIYETEQWNRFDDGVIGATDFVGQPGLEVKNVLEGYINDGGGVADVKVLDRGEAEVLPGYLPSGGFSPSDTIVLTVDSKGAVIATGRVAAIRNTRNVGAALPLAMEAAADAQAAATELRGIGTTVETRFNELSSEITGIETGLGSLQQEFIAYKGGAFDQGGFGARLGHVEGSFGEFRDFGQRLAEIEGKVDIISRLPSGVGGVTPKGMDPNLGKGIADFAKTTVAAMKSLPEARTEDFSRHTEAAERSRVQLEAAIATADQQAIAGAALKVLDTVKTMVQASGASPELGQQLDVQLGALGRLYE